MARARLQRLDWLVARPIAHRGLHDLQAGVIENTSSAIAAAIDANYAVEVDLQRTADHRAVVFHDAILDRLTTHSGPVASRSAAELQRMTVTGSKDRIQTLEELLEQVNGRITLILELKSLWDGCRLLEHAVAKAIATYKGPVAVMSFDPDSVAALGRLAVKTPRGLTCMIDGNVTDGEHLALARRRRVSGPVILNEVQPDFIAHDVRVLPSALTRWTRQKRCPILAWTVRTPDHRRRASLFADQMIFEGFRA